MVWCVGIVRALFVAGVLAGVVGGLWSPWPWVGLFVLAAGLVWAAYDLVDVKDYPDGDS